MSLIRYSRFLSCSAFFFLFSVNAQETHWETIVSAGTTWKYIVPNTQPSDSWKNQSFDTSSWLEGPSGIGYGDDDDATQIPQSISVYMRKEFQVLDTSQIKRILLDIDYDDGFAAYLNGVEIGRNLLSGNPINFNDLAEGHHEAMLYQGNSPERLFLLNLFCKTEQTRLLFKFIINQPLPQT